MGIQGLIPFLEKASSSVNISEYSGCTVGIDAYCWLHKGIFTCADKLCRGESSNLYVHYCMKHVNMLLSYNIKPILVFDGQRLMAKGETEKKRAETREMNRKKGDELLRLNKTQEAEVYLKRCIDITHEMAMQLMRACHLRNVDCIVAPYEADAQLAYFSINNIVQIIITEDSDLLLFGSKKVLFKMDFYGNGLLIEQDKLHVALGVEKENFTMDKFRYMCMLSGCDYLPSLRGIGLIKANRFIRRVSDPDIHRAISRLGSYLNMPQLNVPLEYRDNFVAADAAFLYHPVFDPFSRSIVPLNPLPSETTKIPDYLLNVPLSAEQAAQLSYGNLNPQTLEKVNDWDPRTRSSTMRNYQLNTHNGRSISSQPSIWDDDYLDKQSSIALSQSQKLDSSADSSDHADALPVRVSSFGKRIIRNVFFKKRLVQSTASEEAASPDNNVENIANEYRSQSLLHNAIEESSKNRHEEYQNANDVFCECEEMELDSSRNLISKYFVFSRGSLNRVDVIDGNNFHSLESKLSKIEKSINEDVASDDHRNSGRHLSVENSPAAAKVEQGATDDDGILCSSEEQFEGILTDADVKNPETLNSHRRMGNEMTTSVSPVFRRIKRKNPFLISHLPNNNGNKDGQQREQRLTGWKDYLLNQFSYTKPDRRGNNASGTGSTSNGGVLVDISCRVNRPFKNPVWMANNKPVTGVENVADIMTEDEDEGFCSPSIIKKSDVISPFKKQRRPTGPTKKSVVKSKQMTLTDLFGFNFLAEQISRFYLYLKNLLFPSLFIENERT